MSYGQKVYLRDICRPRQWPTIPESELMDSGFPVYGANGRIGFYHSFNHEEPTILITCRGATCGTVNICGSKSYVTGNAMALDDLDSARVNLKWLSYYLSARGFTDVTSGSAQPQITQSNIGSVEIQLPPLREQERMALILAEADQLRRLRSTADRRTADLIPALFNAMFGDPEKTWPVVKFGELGQLDRGRSKHRPRNEPSLFGGPYPFVQTGDIANCGGRVEAYSQAYSELGLSQSKLWPTGTLCITIAANIAKCAVLTFPACFPDSVVGFIPDERITVDFAQSWLETLEAKLEEEAPQSAQKNINLQILRNLELHVPPIELQQAFASEVAEIRTMETEQAASRHRLDDLFQSLLHRAFQGDL